MITFLWMLYLAFTLFISIPSLETITLVIKGEKIDNDQFYFTLAACILWSIWYMYFLH